MKILRVFPRRTNATPDDELVRVGSPSLFKQDCDEVHISVAFTWDLPEANRLRDEYEAQGYTVKIGGPATGMRGEDFTPGMYLKPGYVITSRGCPNRCWFCSVWKREGTIRELPITEGWNILDDNLLACSEKHIATVFEMLRRQRHAPEFTGGLDPRYMTVEIMREIRVLNPKQIFTAYDSDDDKEFVERAIMNCWQAGFTQASHSVRCFVLIGFSHDTFDEATERLEWIMSLGAIPMAMLYRNQNNQTNPQWRKLQKHWARPGFRSLTSQRASCSERERGGVNRGVV